MPAGKTKAKIHHLVSSFNQSMKKCGITNAIRRDKITHAIVSEFVDPMARYGSKRNLN